MQTRDEKGVGKILTDQSGKTLYSADQESAENIMCTGNYLDSWKQLSVSGNTPPNVAGVTLGAINRPDGKTQVTYQAKPLYTFKLDKAPGDVQGNDFTDKFGGTTFTWHAATTSAAPRADRHRRREPPRLLSRTDHRGRPGWP